MATLTNLLAEMMVLVGDLLVLVAAGAGVLALIGERREWDRPTLRQIWSNGIFGTILVAAGLAAKLGSEAHARQANGYLFGLDNQSVAILLGVALVTLLVAYLLRRQQSTT